MRNLADGVYSFADELTELYVKGRSEEI